MWRILLALVLALFLEGRALAASVAGDPFADDAAFADIPQETVRTSLQLGGYVESRNQIALRDIEQPISIRQRLRLEGCWSQEALSFFGALEAEAELAAMTWDGEGHEVWSARGREAYLTYDTDRLDLFVGRKIHRWGTGDGINPMDLINPLDTRDPIATGRADNRLPVWMAGLLAQLDRFSLEGVFLPVAAVNSIPKPGNPWEPRGIKELRGLEEQGQLRLAGQREPDVWFQDVEYGGRLSAMVAGWDLALLAFHGYADNPVLVSRLSDGALLVVPEHPEFTAFGATFATGLGSRTLRGELAFKPEYPLQEDGELGPTRRDLWQGVLGWDYDLDGRYYLNLQGFADIAGPGGAESTQWWHGLTYEVSGRWLDYALKAGARGKVYTSGDGALTELFTEYDLDDHWKILTGVMLWTGPGNGVLGQYGGNDLVYCTLRYAF
ncbi:MAG: DUF1302 family protein [Desulfocurvibacter africanus]